MSARPVVKNGFFQPLLRRSLQTTAPLPPPTAPLPPPTTVSSSSSSTSSSSSSASPNSISSASIPTSSSASTSAQILSHLPPLIPSTTPPNPLPTTTTSALHLLKSQSTSTTGLYLLARLHSRTYLLHPRDILTLPTLYPLQSPGTTLSLTRILEVGVRDYAIRSTTSSSDTEQSHSSRSTEETTLTIPPWIAKCDLTVLEHTKSPLQVTFKKKRRKGYQKTIKAKHGWTRLRVGDIVLGDGVPVGNGEWEGGEGREETAEVVLGREAPRGLGGEALPLA